MTIDIFSVIPLLLIQLSGNCQIGTATGFLWKDAPSSKYYLVTNYHVLSGKHPTTGKVENADEKTPTSIRVLHNSSKLGEWKSVDYPVVDKTGTPKWREHPKFGHKVDVVLLEIDLPSGVKGYAINDQKWVDLQLRPAENVSIIGFPHGQTAGGLFAIWQTGYIASEPEFDFSALPCLLVDSKAWPGNSGSPVIARRYGSWSLRDGSQGFGAGNSFVTDFIGIYSGRLGKAEMKFVWKRSVIEDILR
jgi:hypothetical protein